MNFFSQSFLFILNVFIVLGENSGFVQNSGNNQEIATLGGGCFWCTEAVFELIKEVEKVVSGYAGGEIENPTYEQVCSGNTGHAEVVQITYDPKKISYKQLLLIFFATHDPTTPNRQGADVGHQYRSVIFYHTDLQKSQAEEIIKILSTKKAFEDKIVIELLPFKNFFPAENYHQDYYKKNSEKAYCSFVISPKFGKIT